MDNYQLILALLIGLALATFTTIRMYREKKFTPKMLIITFILAFIVAVAVWIGLSLLFAQIFPK